MIRSSIARPRRRRPIHFVGLVVSVVALIAGCGDPVTPSPSAATPTPSAVPTPSNAPPLPSGPEACISDDLAVTGGPWGGAAGSRGSDIVVANQGAASCLLPAGPTVAMVDQSGTVVITSSPARAGAGPELVAGESIGFSLLVGNWCDQAVSLPLHFRLALATGGIDIDALAVQSIDDLPPCNGPGELATLSTTDWSPT
jgi:uncharacterized protein DUF4232